MRYAATFDGYEYWRDGREFSVAQRSSTLTVTRRGASLAYRLVRRNKKIRWARTYSGLEQAEATNLRLQKSLVGSGYAVLDGEDIKLPPRDAYDGWKTSCADVVEGDDTRLVFADILSERRDPRGELIVAQMQAENGDPCSALIANRVLDKNRSTFLGPLVGTEAERYVGWRRGFIDHLVLERPREDGRYDFDLTGLLVETLTHPSGELIRSLTLGLDPLTIRREEQPWPPSARRRYYGTPDRRQRVATEAVSLLIALAPIALQRLTLRAGWVSSQAELSLGDLSSLIPSLPRLTQLNVEGGEMIVDTSFDAPNLKKLVLDGFLSDESAESLARSTIPNLESLIVGVYPSSNAMSTLVRAFGNRVEVSASVDSR